MLRKTKSRGKNASSRVVPLESPQAVLLCHPVIVGLTTKLQDMKLDSPLGLRIWDNRGGLGDRSTRGEGSFLRPGWGEDGFAH